jgi:hypothetical protein
MDYQKPKDTCPKCHLALEEIYRRSKHTDCLFDLTVYKCQNCKSYLAYWVEESDQYSAFEPAKEGANPTGHSFPLEHSSTKRISKRCAAAYSKSTVAMENRNKELDILIKEKLPQLYEVGLSIATINFAKNRVPHHLKDKKLTRKGAAKLLAGAIYATANDTIMEGSSLWKHQGEGITEEKVAEIFGLTRKTVRKWKKVFDYRPLYSKAKHKT